ncbi:MAG TPA: hypothetical protein VFP80_14765 [Thermoanaerobaculia bacterium]|nr:hypothetical protein [Thermoanaerobaculia bacterium]
MSKIEKPMSFEEFRLSHRDTLREHLRDDVVAETILREGSASPGWIPWPENALATES